MTILFATYSHGTAVGTLPKLRGIASPSVLGNTALGRLPRLRGYASPAITASGQLPRLRSVATSLSGQIAIGRLPKLKGYASSTGVMEPAIAFGYGALPRLRSIAHGFSTTHANGTGTLPGLRSVASPLAGPMAIGRLPRLRSIAMAAALPQNFATLYLSPGYMAAISTAMTPTMLLREQLRFDAVVDAQAIYLLREKLAMGDAPTSVLEALAALGEKLGFAEIVGIAYKMLVAETLGMAATPTAWAQVAMQLADTLTLAGGAGSALDAQVAVATAFALQDTLARVWPDTLGEALGLSDAANTTMQATLKLLDALRVQGQASNTVTFLVQCAEDVNLADAVSSTAEFQNFITEGLGLLAQITIDDATYLAWVVNTETRAPVKYRNFPFNSFAKVGKRYFGASSDGIYELAGDDDAGEPINAVLRGGLSDLGTSLLKRQHAMYLGFTTDGRMVVMATAVNAHGEREEHWYAVEERPAGALTESRIKIGKGLKSTYWGWGLANVDGADFALDTIAWYPMILERRLN